MLTDADRAEIGLYEESISKAADSIMRLRDVEAGAKSPFWKSLQKEIEDAIENLGEQIFAVESIVPYQHSVEADAILVKVKRARINAHRGLIDLVTKTDTRIRTLNSAGEKAKLAIKAIHARAGSGTGRPKVHV